MYDAGLERQHACLQCVSQQHRWSDRLLAVMVAEGGERALSQSLLFYLQDSNTPGKLLLATEQPCDPGSSSFKVSVCA